MTAPRWEHFEHEADLGVRGIGATREEAFEQAARALTAALLDPDTVELHDEIEIACEAPDDELLLVDWLNGLVFEMATRRMVFGSFEVSIQDHRLAGRARGERVNVERHQPAVEVKGATYTALRVSCDENGAWCAQCVVDV